MADFKIYINAVRANTGMSQEAFAKALGVSCGTVKNWESGAQKPDLDQLHTMSELSGIPMDYIFLKSSPSISDYKEGT